MHPYKMKPSEADLKIALYKADSVQGKVPSTTCSNRGECCRAGCPNMYYCEYVRMAEHVAELPLERRAVIIEESLRRYLKPQVVDDPKPCLFLSETIIDGVITGSRCDVYEVRPLKCRLYGLIPEEMYKRNVASVAREMEVEKERVPLCVQCDQVRGRVMAESEIAAMEKDLRQADLVLGMPKSVQDDGFGFLTFHDWHLMTQLGEEWLEGLSALRLRCSDDEKEQFVAALKAELASCL